MTKIYLVGAGPGDTGLITVKGKELLSRADVVVYDYLSDGALLQYAPKTAKFINVGKVGFKKHITQDEINEILISEAHILQAAKGGTIVRLKGGDPFVFGRGGEEALACVQAHIPFEIVPGITSGIAAPAYAGIPVTHRGVSSSVTFVTGNEDPTKETSALDWASLAGMCASGSTLCFYMGVKNLASIANSLMKEGVLPTTPASLIQWGTKPIQRTLVASLEDIATRAQEENFGAPCIILIGQVARLREDIAWLEEKPLFGLSVVVTRSRTQASNTTQRLEQLGAHVVELPTIQICSHAQSDEMRIVAENLDAYNWVVFTSVNGVENFFETLHMANKDARAFAHAQVAAIGPATSARLKEYGIYADVVPHEYRAEAVAEALVQAGIQPGEKLLLPRAQVARDVLVEQLQAMGVQIDVVAAYETIVPQDVDANGAKEILNNASITAFTFASSSTVKNFAAMVGDDFSIRMKEKIAYSIGPITSQTLRDLGVEHIVEADEYTIDGLIEKIVETYGGHHRANVNQE